MHPLKHSMTSGMSLLEMLVALAIITALAACLKPAIEGIMVGYRSTQCVSKLKQLHQAFALYSMENNGKIPAYRTWNEKGEGGPSWSTVIKPYLMPDASTAIYNKYLLCPAEEKLADNHYAMNYEIGSGIYLSEVTLPSQCFFIGDGNGTARITPAKVSTEAKFRHSAERMNILFFDGHVAARALSEIPAYANRTSAEYKTFWLGSQ